MCVRDKLYSWASLSVEVVWFAPSKYYYMPCELGGIIHIRVHTYNGPKFLSLVFIFCSLPPYIYIVHTYKNHIYIFMYIHIYMYMFWRVVFISYTSEIIILWVFTTHWASAINSECIRHSSYSQTHTHHVTDRL